MRYYRNGTAYIGGYGDGAEPPAGAVEVPAPPQNAAATWNGAAWIEPPPPRVLIPLGTVLFRIIAGGHLNAVLAVLQAEPTAAATLLTLREGIYADDAQASALLAAAGADPAVILAP